MKKILLIYLALGIALISFLFLKTTDQASAIALNISTTIEQENEIEQIGPPWYDEDWHYRQPLIITNQGNYLSYYQVLVELTNNNFDFNLAKADGSDIRIVDSDGISDLNFWIESWDKTNCHAYLWFRISRLGNGSSTIYIYYDNPNATPVSNGNTTFDSFEDQWIYFSDEAMNLPIETPPMATEDNNINFPFAWTTLSGHPQSSSGILTLEDGEGIKSNSEYLYRAMGMKANFRSGNGNKWGGFIEEDFNPLTMIGDISEYPDNLYLINNVTMTNTVLMDGNWHNNYHIYELRWNSSHSEANIDHNLLPIYSAIQVPNTSLPLILYSFTGSNSNLEVDWIYIRQYRDPEPYATLGEPQGLVNLGVTLSDSPDPIPQGNDLTYVVIASNTSNIEAPGVVVTDTLPNAVAFVSANAPGGCTHNGNLVVCNLNTIPANSSRNATIVVKPTADGYLSNSAVVGSPSYELELSNNSDQITTLVDSIPPTVSWLLPTTNRNTFYTEGGWVTLEATASDIGSQVARVEFWYYIDNTPYKINEVTTAPYRIQYDSNSLTPNKPRAFEVFAFDQANNRSITVPEIMRQVIWIERISINKVYLPLTIK
jgi:uncharacterized repeat protein (TIGR01451 family)